MLQAYALSLCQLSAYTPVRCVAPLSEMTVVRNEFERGENAPSSVLGKRIMTVAYAWHNYGKATIGNRSDIERVSIENLQAFYRKYYQPEYRKIKRPLPPTARTHPVAHPALPGSISRRVSTREVAQAWQAVRKLATKSGAV